MGRVEDGNTAEMMRTNESNHNSETHRRGSEVNSPMGDLHMSQAAKMQGVSGKSGFAGKETIIDCSSTAETSFPAAQATTRSQRLMSDVEKGGTYVSGQANVRLKSGVAELHGGSRTPRSVDSTGKLVDVDESRFHHNECELVSGVQIAGRGGRLGSGSSSGSTPAFLPVASNSKIFLLDNSGNGRAGPRVPKVTEVGELPPRFEPWDLPCYFAKQPKRVLIIKRTHTPEVSVAAGVLALLLMKKWDIEVVVEPEAKIELENMGVPGLVTWHMDEDQHSLYGKRYTVLSSDIVPNTSYSPSLGSKIDLVVAMGGDGTILWVSHLFPDVVPPVVAIGMGSMGYLTQFDSDDLPTSLESIFNLEVFHVQLRARLHCYILNEDVGSIMGEFHCVNDTVIDRGSAPSLASLDVYVNDSFFTTVAADGLIIATPTGSTAYSLSAGGSMVHPHVPCIVFTPICPHSLSMRPLVFPDSAIIKLVNPKDARSSVWVSFDGRNRTQVERGHSILISLSSFPFPLVRKEQPGTDPWLRALTTCLNFNARIRQKEHGTVSEDPLGGPGSSAFSLYLRPDLINNIPRGLKKWWFEQHISSISEPNSSPAIQDFDQSNAVDGLMTGGKGPTPARFHSGSRFSNELPSAGFFNNAKSLHRTITSSSVHCCSDNFSDPPRNCHSESFSHVVTSSASSSPTDIEGHSNSSSHSRCPSGSNRCEKLQESPRSSKVRPGGGPTITCGSLLSHSLISPLSKFVSFKPQQPGDVQGLEEHSLSLDFVRKAVPSDGISESSSNNVVGCSLTRSDRRHRSCVFECGQPRGPSNESMRVSEPQGDYNDPRLKRGNTNGLKGQFLHSLQWQEHYQRDISQIKGPFVQPVNSKIIAAVALSPAETPQRNVDTTTNRNSD